MVLSSHITASAHGNIDQMSFYFQFVFFLIFVFSDIFNDSPFSLFSQMSFSKILWFTFRIFRFKSKYSSPFWTIHFLYVRSDTENTRFFNDYMSIFIFSNALSLFYFHSKTFHWIIFPSALHGNKECACELFARERCYKTKKETVKAVSKTDSGSSSVLHKISCCCKVFTESGSFISFSGIPMCWCLSLSWMPGKKNW